MRHEEYRTRVRHAVRHKPDAVEHDHEVHPLWRSPVANRVVGADNEFSSIRSAAGSVSIGARGGGGRGPHSLGQSHGAASMPAVL